MRGVASVAVSVKLTLARLNQPFVPSGVPGLVASVVTGGVVSSLMFVVVCAPSLPALSTDQYSTVWSP